MLIIFRNLLDMEDSDTIGVRHGTKTIKYDEHIGVNTPAIVREIPHFDVFPAFLR